MTGNARGTTASELLAEAERLAHVDPDAALTTLDRMEATTQLTSESVSAGACYLRAQLAAMAGNFVTALALISQARHAWRAAGAELDAIGAGLGEMHVLDDLGRHQNALEVGHAMLATLAGFEAGSPEEEKTRQSLTARALHNVGTAHGLIGEHAKALAAYTEAERIWQRLGLEPEQAMQQGNRGVELTATGRAHDALAQFDLAARTFARLGDSLSSATFDGYRADALVRLGRFPEALDLYERSRLELDRLGASTQSARLSLQTAQTYLRLDLAEEADHLAKKAIAHCREASLEHDRASAELICGDAALRRQDYDGAIGHLNAAVAGFELVGDGLGQVEALLVRSRYSASRGQNEASERDARRALQLADAATWPPAAIESRLALVDLAPGTEEADRLLTEAERRADELPIPDLHYGIQWRQGRQLRLAGRRAEARATLEATIAKLETARTSLTDDRLRRSFSYGRSAAQQEYLRLAISGGTDEQIDGVLRSDEARTRTLVERRARRQDEHLPASATDHVSAELRAAYAELMHSGTRSLPDRHQLLDRVAELERHSLIQGLQNFAHTTTQTTTNATTTSPITTNPASTTIRSEPRTPTIPVVIYLQLDDEILALVRSGGADTVHRHLTTASQLDRIVDELETHWSRQRLPSDFTQRHAERLLGATNNLLERLHQMLLRPLADELSSSSGKRLLIVPDGVVHRIPFAALTDGDQCVAERWSVTTAPSAALADRLPQAASAPASALILGIRDDDTPNVGSEVESVAAVYASTDRRLDEAATMEALRVGAQQADIVHVACHGLFRSDNPMFSAIQLWDGWVTAQAVAEISFDGALVVLSACESGRMGRRGRGDESTGLTWSLLAAGAVGVIVSLWLVDDAVTADLMRRLHNRLSKGCSPDSALRRAQLEIRQRHPHPYLWAPFVYVGGTRHLTPHDTNIQGTSS